MYYFRPANERGQANFGWLESKHSFSFGHYYDPQHMGVSALRVINDDRVRPGAGFDTHGHRDMEIISYVLEGAIEHRDSMGNHFIVPAGEVQRMSAGTGLSHSEYNHSSTDSLRFLQIWIKPNRQGIKPGYEQKQIQQNGLLTALATPDGRDDSLTLHQDAYLYRLQLQTDQNHTFTTQDRPGYLHIISGEAHIGERTLGPGDAIAAVQETLQVKGRTAVTALWFDLPALNNG